MTFLNSEIVKQALKKDDVLCNAINQVLEFFPTVAESLCRPAIRQTDFIATVARKDNDYLKPLGIAVKEISDDRIRGTLLENTSSKPRPGVSVECSLDQVIDLRFTDAFDCMGGFLFREFYRRLEPEVRNPLWEKLDFLPIWDSDRERDPQFCELLSDIANLRYETVQSKLSQDVKLASKVEFAPRPSHRPQEIKVMLNLVTPMQYAAEFGDATMIQGLHSIGAIDDQPGGNSPLCWSATRGNYETTLAMLKLGFDPEVTDKHGCWPLHDGAAWGREDIVELLLNHGVDVNHQGNRDQTALFATKSTSIAEKLLHAGARTDLMDDEGRTCVAWHNEHGRTDMVKTLVQHGAAPPTNPPGLNEKEVMQRGREVLQELLANEEQFARSYMKSVEVDYGYVLPVEFLD